MVVVPAKQRGLGITGWIFVIAIALFFGILAMKMVPAYLDFFATGKVMENMAQDPELKGLTPQELRKRFFTRVDINGIYDLPKESFHVRRDGRTRKLELDYEVRQPLVGNVDILMRFHKEVEMPRR